MSQIFVESITTYPLKSGRGNAHRDSIEVVPTGLKHDRVVMLVRADSENKGRFISQRDKGFSGLSQVQTNVVDMGDILRLSFAFPNNTSFDVNVKKTAQADDVRVWSSECKGIDAGEEVGNYFSEYFKSKVKVMVYPSNEPRLTDPNYSHSGDVTSYADGFPILITSTPSFVSLREKFESSAMVGMENFRPNIVLGGALQPFEEDTMSLIRIGNCELEIIKPCARCIMTTINQATSETGAKEPLRSLTAFRRGKGGGLQGVFFGQNAIPRVLGVIKVGDKVEVLNTREVHPALQMVGLGFDKK